MYSVGQKVVINFYSHESGRWEWYEDTAIVTRLLPSCRDYEVSSKHSGVMNVSEDKSRAAFVAGLETGEAV